MTLPPSDKTDKTDKTPMDGKAAGVDFATLGALSHAKTGNVGPLARHIEAGGYICPATRRFLASHLRSEVKNPPGNRRIYAKICEDARTACHIMFLRRMLGKKRGQIFVMASEEKAKLAFLDLNPDMNLDTLTSILRRSRRRPKGVNKPR
jgi:hypothetical protein